MTKNLDHWLRAGFKEAFGYERERKKKRQNYPSKEAPQPSKAPDNAAVPCSSVNTERSTKK